MIHRAQHCAHIQYMCVRVCVQFTGARECTTARLACKVTSSIRKRRGARKARRELALGLLISHWRLLFDGYHIAAPHARACVRLYFQTGAPRTRIMCASVYTYMYAYAVNVTRDLEMTVARYV